MRGLPRFPIPPSALLVIACCLLLGPFGWNLNPAEAPERTSAWMLSSPGPEHGRAASTVAGSDSPMALLANGSWENLTSQLAVVPSNRSFAQFAYDPQIRGDVLFGGRTGSGGADADTWVFANDSWTNVSSRLSPSPDGRWGGSLAWDPELSGLVLFGGRSPYSQYNDTWVFNASGWTSLELNHAPYPRESTVFDYNPNMTGMYLFGGVCSVCYGGLGAQFTDSWLLIHGIWQNLTGRIQNAPPTLSYSAYDAGDGYLLGFAHQSGCRGSNTTYAFNGTTWRVLNTTHAPDLTGGGRMVYDSARHRVELFGGSHTTHAGSSCPSSASTWAYSNGSWSNLTPGLPRSPTTRVGEAVTYDDAMGLLVLDGGDLVDGQGNASPVGDLWTFPARPFLVTAANYSLVGFAPLVLRESAVTYGGSGTLSFRWNFGDGTANTSNQSVEHTYAIPGTFELAVQVTDSSGRGANWSWPVRVASPLLLRESSSPTSGEAPFLVEFSAWGAFGFPPYQVTWQFGDGSAAGPGNTSHTYSSGGTFTAEAELVDARGFERSTNVTVTVAGPIALGILVTPVERVVPFTVEVTAVPLHGIPPYFVQWSFGDGSGENAGLNVSHQYTTAGTFTILSSVTDAAGRMGSSRATVLALAPVVSEVIPSGTCGLPPCTLHFVATSDGGIGAPYAYVWSFGDGTPTSAADAPDHSFDRSGSFVVRVRATDNFGNSGNASVAVIVPYPLQLLSATASLTLGTAPLAVTFSAELAGGVAPETVHWVFGDGGIAYSLNTSHLYARPSPSSGYRAELAVLDSLGESLHQFLTITVNPPVSVRLTGPGAPVILGANVTFLAAASGGLGALHYRWTGLPAGCPSADASELTCTPRTTGNYTVTLDVTDAANGHATSSTGLLVEPAPSRSSSVPPPRVSLEFVVIAGLGAAALSAFLLARWGWAHRRSPGAELGRLSRRP